MAEEFNEYVEEYEEEEETSGTEEAAAPVAAEVSPAEETPEAAPQPVTAEITPESVPPGTPVVIDVGEATCKVGFAGIESPVAIFPTIVGREKYKAVMVDAAEHARTAYVGDDCAHMRGVLKITYPISRGNVMDWESFYEVLTHIFYNVLRVNPADHPVIYVEHPLTPPDTRQYIARVLFDTYQVPSLFMTNSALLALFSVGLVSGLVLEVGEGQTFIVPVANGEIYPAGLQKLNLGSVDISEHLKSLLLRYGKSLDFSAQKEILRDIKEKNCYVALDPAEEKVTSAQRDVVQYVLPDGEYMPVDGETRYLAPEILFNPQLLGYPVVGIPQAIIESLRRLDYSWRREMLEHVVVCGGTTCLKGFDLRLEKELNALVPQLGPLPPPAGHAEPAKPKPSLVDVSTSQKVEDDCPQCGTTVNLVENAHRCPSCGYEFPKVQIKISSAAVRPTHCPACNKPLGEDAAFCPFCGAKVENVQAPAPGAVPPVPAVPPPPVTGGGSEFGGAEEFQEESQKVLRLHVPTDRITAAFKGASILGSLESFRALLVTRDQFYANPASIDRTFKDIL